MHVQTAVHVQMFAQQKQYILHNLRVYKDLQTVLFTQDGLFVCLKYQ